MTQPVAENYFIFARSGLQFAVQVAQMLEIVELPPLLPPHCDLPGYLGNVSHREHLLPVMDPVAVTTRTKEGEPARSFLVVKTGGIFFGFLMDRFVTVAPLDAMSDSERDPGGETDSNPYVETIRAFRDNSLILPATGPLAALVGRRFGRQRNMLDGEGSTRQVQTRTASAAESRIFLCAQIEQALFAVAVEHVVEVIEGYDVTPLFKVPSMIRGLIALRGQVLACLDISTDLGLPARVLEERNQFVVLKDETSELALCVDRVSGIRSLQPDRIQKAELVLSGGMTRYASGVYEEPDGALFALSVSAVFDAPQLVAFRSQEP